MSSESPAAELYSSDGFELSAQNATSIPAGTRGLLSMGSDGTNSHFIKVDASGNVIVVGAGVAGTPAGGVITIQGVTSGTAVTVAGTVTGNQGTANTTANAWPIKVTDGTNTSAVKAASTAAVATDPSLVVAFSPNSPLPTGTNSIGTVNQGTANVLANAWSQKITDGTNGPVAVKAPSTAAVAADPALVVTLSPNSIAQSNATGSGTVAALNGNVVATAAGYGSIIFDITGTWAGTLTTQATNGDGTWINVAALSNQSGLITQSVTINGTVEMNAAGWTQARLIATAWTSGTATVTWSAGQGSHVMIAYQGNGINLQTNTALVDSNQNFLGVTLASTAATASQEALVVGLSPNSPLPTGTNSIGTVNQGTANTLANAWSQKITDGTNGPVAVKAPSTAAVATDPALVVAISPNNSLAFTTNDSTSTGTLGALNATVQLAVAGEKTAGMQLVAGTLIGTIVPEISMDGGTTWVQTFFDDPSTSNIMTSVVFASSNTATTKSIIGAGGSSHVRVRVSAYTSGTATCNLRGVQLEDPSIIFGGAAGSALPPVVAQDGGSVTTSAPTYSTGTLNPLSLNTTGDLRVTGKVTDGTNTAAVKAASTPAVAADPALVVTLSPNSNQSTNNSYPNPIEYTTSTNSETIDLYGNLQTRGPVFTDEGSFRDDFSGSALTTTLTGTLTFTNGSTNVTGSGTSFLTAIKQLQYIKQSSDSETLYIQVFSVQSNTQLTLLSPYAGTTTSGATAVISNWQTTTGSGGSISVSGSVVTIASGTTVAAATQIKSLGDYGPYSGLFYCQISQRIANQTAYIGFQDPSGTRLAMMQFTGTNNTQALFVTSYSGAEIQATTVTLPNGGTTATYHQYKIDISATQVTCSIDGIIVGVNALHIPGPYDLLFSVIGINNSSPAPASSTTIQTDYFFYEDVDRVQVLSSFPGEPLPARLTDGTNVVAVKAGSTLPVATDPALVVTLSPNNGIFVVDKASMTPGVQAGQPTIGQSSMVGRIPRLNRLGHTVPGDQTLMAYDPIEGTTVNSWLWASSTATMTIAQTTGLLILNNNSTTTTTTDAIITSNIQFSILNETPIECSFRALATQTTNSTIELGFGAPTGTTAIINNGAFFRIQNSGQIKCVTSFNGTETVSAVLATLTTTSYYLFIVTMEDDGSRFIVEDANGIPLVDTYRALPVATASNTATSHIPAFARVYNSGAAGAAAQLKISSFQAWRFDISCTKPWAHQLAGAGKSSGIDPTTFTQTGQIFTTAPSAAVLTTSGVNYTTLGGDFDIGQAGGNENTYGIFGYQVPSPYSLYVTDIYMPQPFVTTQLGGTLNIQEWSFMIANSNNPTTATGYRYSLGIFTAPVNAAVGTIYTGTPITQTFTTPLLVQPGQYFLIICKHLYGTTTGVTRGTILVNGYFE